MNVGCPQCSSIFRVDPAKVPPGGVRARCSICGGVIPVPEPTAELIAAGPQPPGGRSTPPYSRKTPPSGMPMQPAAAAAAQRAATPAAGYPMRTPTAGVSRLLTPAAGNPRMPTPAYGTPALEEPPRATPAAPMQQELRAAPAVSGQHEASAAPAEPMEEDVSVAPVAPAQEQAGRAAATPTPVPRGVPGPTASINPYLARDPDIRAKRLARALISDIVTYYPTKHADALRAGSLKQTFSEEIKKSYEEYVAQVGQAFAEATSHFKDALNDVLGEGKRIF